MSLCFSQALRWHRGPGWSSRKAENVFYTATSCQKRHILKIHNLKIHFSFQLQLGKFHAATPWLRAQKPSHTPLKNRLSKCLAFFWKRIGYLPKILAKFLILTNPFFFFFLINIILLSIFHLLVYHVITLCYIIAESLFLVAWYMKSLLPFAYLLQSRERSFLATFLNSLFSFQLYWGIVDT